MGAPPEERRAIFGRDWPLTQTCVLWLVFGLLLTGVVVGARYFYLRQRNEIRESRVLLVQGTTLVHGHRIEEWIDARKRDAVVLATTISRHMQADRPHPAGQPLTAARLFAEVLRDVRGYRSIHILTTDGLVVLHVHSGDDLVQAPDTLLSRAVLQSAQPLISLRWGPSSDLSLQVAAPIPDPAGPHRYLGVAVLEIPAETTLFQLLRTLTGPSPSWETVLVFTDARRHVFLRRPGPPPVHPPQAQASPANDTVLKQVLAGKYMHLLGIDAKGRSYLAHAVPLAELGWVLVGRERLAETERLVAAFTVPYAAAVAALIAVAVALLGYAWQRYRTEELEKELKLETAARQAQQELAQSQALLRVTLDTVPQRIFWKDRQSRYLGCNVPFAADAGREKPEDLLGKDDYEMSWVANADAYRRDDREVMETGQPKLGYEEPQDYPDGTRRWLRTSKVPLKADDGSIYGVLGTYEDITEQVKTRKELEEAHALLSERNRDLSQLLYIVSHDLRSPLVTILGFIKEMEASLAELEQLLWDVPLSEEQAGRLLATLRRDLPEQLEFMREAAHGMDRLLRGILDTSRLDRMPYRRERVDMTALAEQVVRAFRTEAAQRPAKIQVEPIPSCVGDPDKLEMVLRNLLSNALKYLSPARPGKIRIWGRLEGGYAVYCVEDNGIGIPQDLHEKVFEMFFRAAPDNVEGDGLGLTSVRTIVRRHGGRVWIESEPGEGTRVYFTIPTRLNRFREREMPP